MTDRHRVLDGLERRPGSTRCNCGACVLDAISSLRAEVAELRKALDKVAIYVSRSGACSNAPDGDPWDGYCDEPGCDYCDMARATQAALDQEPTP
jgi:hypothetical protein